jgi:hypothetical protein
MGGAAMSRHFLELAFVFGPMLLPAQQPVWQLMGPDHHEYFLIEPFEDYDGDGVRDLLFMVYPSPTTSGLSLVKILSGATGAELWQFPLWFATLTSVGDLNGDGSPDFVGMRFHATYATSTSPAMNVIQAWSPADNRMLWECYGPHPANYGWDTIGNLDTDGDGRPNVVTLSWSGAQSDVYVYNHHGIELYRLPFAPSNREAISLAGVGDIDGDGADDFIVGVSEMSFRGEVRLISGRTGATLRNSYGLQPGDGTFEHATNFGDLDGDGVNDYGAFPWWSAARAKPVVWSGATGAVLRTYSDYADSLIACEDFDLDGVNDLLINNEFPVQPPNIYGRTIVYSGRDGTELWRLENSWGSGQPSYGWGRHAASLGVQPGSPYPVVSWYDYGFRAYFFGFPFSLGRIRAFRTTFANQGPVHGQPCSSNGSLPLIGARKTSTGSRITIAKAPSGSLAWLNLMLGSPGSYGGTALPVSLSPWGMPTCELYVGPEVSFLRTTGTQGIDRGYAAVDLNVHLATSQGIVVQAQWLTFDPATGNYSATARHSLRVQ